MINLERKRIIQVQHNKTLGILNKITNQDNNKEGSLHNHLAIIIRIIMGIRGLKKIFTNTIRNMDNQSKRWMISSRIVSGLKTFGMRKVPLAKSKGNNISNISKVSSKTIVIIKLESSNKSSIIKTNNRIIKDRISNTQELNIKSMTMKIRGIMILKVNNIDNGNKNELMRN